MSKGAASTDNHSLLHRSRPYLWARKTYVGARQLGRLAAWRLKSAQYPAAGGPIPGERFDYVWSERRMVIARRDTGAHPTFEAGKRHNVALAAAAFDGVVFSRSAPLSFWRVLGPATAARGYVSGMELKGGCVVPAVGGGICLLSNGLFSAAVTGGLEILERHGHSLEAVPPAAGELVGMDATVFYPHVDLRIAPRGLERLKVEARIEDGVLTLRLLGDRPRTCDVTLEQVENCVRDEAAAQYRHVVIERVIRSAHGVRRDRVVETTRRLLPVSQPDRSCLTCAEHSCSSRQVHVLTPNGVVVDGRQLRLGGARA